MSQHSDIPRSARQIQAEYALPYTRAKAISQALHSIGWLKNPPPGAVARAVAAAKSSPGAFAVRDAQAALCATEPAQAVLRAPGLSESDLHALQAPIFESTSTGEQLWREVAARAWSAIEDDELPRRYRHLGGLETEGSLPEVIFQAQTYHYRGETFALKRFTQTALARYPADDYLRALWLISSASAERTGSWDTATDFIGSHPSVTVRTLMVDAVHSGQVDGDTVLQRCAAVAEELASIGTGKDRAYAAHTAKRAHLILGHTERARHYATRYNEAINEYAPDERLAVEKAVRSRVRGPRARADRWMDRLQQVPQALSPISVTTSTITSMLSLSDHPVQQLAQPTLEARVHEVFWSVGAEVLRRIHSDDGRLSGIDVHCPPGLLAEEARNGRRRAHSRLRSRFGPRWSMTFDLELDLARIRIDDTGLPAEVAPPTIAAATSITEATAAYPDQVLAFGLYADGDTAHWHPPKAPSMLLCGGTGSGIVGAVATTVRAASDAGYEIALIGGAASYDLAAGTPNVVATAADDAAARALVARCVVLTRQRHEDASIPGENSGTAAAPTPLLVVVANPHVADSKMVTYLLREGPQVRVHVLLALMRPPTRNRAVLQVHVGAPSEVDRMMLVGERENPDDLQRLNPAVRGRMLVLTGREPIAGQLYLPPTPTERQADDREAARLYSRWR